MTDSNSSPNSNMLKSGTFKKRDFNYYNIFDTRYSTPLAETLSQRMGSSSISFSKSYQIEKSPSASSSNAKTHSGSSTKSHSDTEGSSFEIINQDFENVPHPELDQGPVDFWLEMKKGTDYVHGNVKREVKFMNNLIHGDMSSSEYVDYLQQLSHMYHHLEQAIQKTKTTHPNTVGKVYFKELLRFDKSILDLKYFLKELGKWDGVKDLPMEPMSEMTKVYVSRLHILQQTDPDLLVAHSFVRNMADLHGGQMIGKIMKRNFQECSEDNNNGVETYEFGGKEAVKRLKKEYRDSMNEIVNGFEGTLEEKIVLKKKLMEEAVDVFIWIMLMLEEVDIQHGEDKIQRDFTTMKYDALQTRKERKEDVAPGTYSRCPFAVMGRTALSFVPNPHAD